MADKVEDKKPIQVVKPLSTKQSEGGDVVRWLKKLIKTKFASVAVILLLAGLPSYYFYHKSVIANQKLNNPTEASKKAIDEVVSKVSRHIILPKDETPTMASITDLEKVKSQGQAFFMNAQQGDKILVYTQAGKAYLYRPSKDIIVEVAQLNINQLPITGQ